MLTVARDVITAGVRGDSGTSIKPAMSPGITAARVHRMATTPMTDDARALALPPHSCEIDAQNEILSRAVFLRRPGLRTKSKFRQVPRGGAAPPKRPNLDFGHRGPRARSNDDLIMKSRGRCEDIHICPLSSVVSFFLTFFDAESVALL
jgi:hypothetical protein